MKMHETQKSKRNPSAAVLHERYRDIYTLIIIASILILIVGIFVVWNALTAIV
jgi:uncharacterized integral membrane protein